ncbi:hypothetical protein ABZ464_01880 [Streptomyces sp. NPDC005820]
MGLRQVFYEDWRMECAVHPDERGRRPDESGVLATLEIPALTVAPGPDS